MTAPQVVLGRIGGLHGVRGELKLVSYTDPPRRILDYRPWLLQAPDGRTLEIERPRGRAQAAALLITLPEIISRDAAALWVGSEVRVARAALPPLPDGQWYWADLEGLTVRNRTGVELGRVSHLLATGANDVLVVHDGTRERLIPFVPGQWVDRVDPAAGCIVVDWDPAF